MMHVACGANAAYMPYVAAMLHSLLAQPRRMPLTVHFMHDAQLPEAELERLREMVLGCGAEGWQSHCIGTEQLQMFPPNRRFGREAWYRTLLPQLLADQDKVLYLDADTIVRRSIEPLWSTGLSDVTLAAVVNPLYRFMDDGFQRALGIHRAQDYFNSGVLLMNLQRWRARKTDAALQAFIRDHAEQQNWPDQNALNAVLKGEWLMLEPIWNAQNIYFDLPARQLPISARQWREVRDNPAIVHFIAPFKPWDYLCKHPYRADYFRHSAQTPWAGHAIHGKSMTNRLLRLLPQPFMWMFTQVFLRRLRKRFRLAWRHRRLAELWQ